MKVGVAGHFDSMHVLPGYPKCGVPHGHTYKVEVEVEGPVVRGIVIDFGDLKAALHAVLADFDHTDLNRILPMPSCENLCLEILARLQARLGAPDRRLTVRLWEGEGKWAQAAG